MIKTKLVRNICKAIDQKDYPRQAECDRMEMILKALNIEPTPEAANRLVLLKDIFSAEEIAEIIYNESIQA